MNEIEKLKEKHWIGNSYKKPIFKSKRFKDNYNKIFRKQEKQKVQKLLNEELEDITDSKLKHLEKSKIDYSLFPFISKIKNWKNSLGKIHYKELIYISDEESLNKQMICK